MNTATDTLSNDARRILNELGVHILAESGGAVYLADEQGPYKWYQANVVERATEAVADADAFKDDEDRTALAYRFEAFHDALDEGVQGS